MFRFVMPDPARPRSEQLRLLRTQFEEFINSDALRELFALLEADRSTFSRIYNGRQLPDGTIVETQDLEPVKALNRYREKLYPLLKELGFLTINKALAPDYSHVIVLGGSLEACYTRTKCAKERMIPSVRFVDGLACYRPIHPIERAGGIPLSNSETEFGAMSESFTTVFSLSHPWKDDFHGDRNLNSISCFRVFPEAGNGIHYRVFAAPSTQPELRRADTGDSFQFYLQHAEIQPSDSLLFLTNNRYCNRQFLQLAFLMMDAKRPYRFDVIGCTPDDRIISCERYDPYQFLQDLIGLLDWIERFNRELF